MKIRWQNPFEYFDKVYVINLDRRIDRLRGFLDEMEKIHMGIEPLRISGVEHENPAHGCHLSHAKIFMDALESGYDRVLILEDDVEFFPNAKENLMLALKELPQEWDMFYLGANLDVYKAYQVSEHIAKLTGAYATHAYAVRRPLFTSLVEINVNMSTVHNDVVYAQNIHPKYRCYLSIPLIAGQRDNYSDIQKTMMSSNQVFLSRLESNLVKLNGNGKEGNQENYGS